ncbi:hypothetical protein C8Q75DRAFT_787634 [Abortiporus biennis]|nr:hypothetical protein C8Q75DRAFT_787634 [Abortiporus biennis]
MSVQPLTFQLKSLSAFSFILLFSSASILTSLTPTQSPFYERTSLQIRNQKISSGTALCELRPRFLRLQLS